MKPFDFATAPHILISPADAAAGSEFGDGSISLAETYQKAVINAGGLPLVLPGATDAGFIAECVRRCDGVLLTGGEDLDPRLYCAGPVPPELAATVVPEAGLRDTRELRLIEEIFRQRKPVLGICRGHQILNVALGGDLIIDIPRQLPAALPHRLLERKAEFVHEVRLAPGSRLAQITGQTVLGVNSTHHQAVGRVAAPLAATGLSPDGVVEVLELAPDGAARLPFFLSVQFHPERLADRHPEHAAIFTAFVQACRAARPAI